MANKLTLPQFGKEYDQQKMRALISDLERELLRRDYRQREVVIVNAASYTATGTEDVLIVEYTDTGAATINLPAPALFKGRTLVILDKDANASVNNIALEDADAGTVLTIGTNGECVTIASDGTDWYVEARS